MTSVSFPGTTTCDNYSPRTVASGGRRGSGEWGEGAWEGRWGRGQELRESVEERQNLT